MTANVAVLVGSLRKGSYNLMIAKALAALAPATLKFNVIEIGNLPFYNEDIEANAPAEWTAFRTQLKASDAVLFITPEYNRSTPAAIKNAIDVGSRPYGSSVWDGKPGAVISSSPGAIGGFGANHHLRQSLVFLNVPAMPFEVYLGGVNKLFDEQGQLTNDGTKDFLNKFLKSFEAWVETNRKR
jgi:chromate reductase